MTDKEYKICREKHMEFSQKILQMDPHLRKRVEIAAKKFQMWEDGSLVMEDEDDVAFLMDFNLYEKADKYGRYLDTIDTRKSSFSLEEQEMIEQLKKNYNSVFEVKDIDKSNSIVTLFDLISKKVFLLKDIGISSTSQIGALFYLRMIPIKEDLYMTSGVVLGFLAMDFSKISTALKNTDSKRRFRRRNNKPVPKQTLYEIMYKCHQSYGIKAFYENV